MFHSRLAKPLFRRAATGRRGMAEAAQPDFPKFFKGMVPPPKHPVQVRNRPHLPDCTSLRLPEFLNAPSKEFPTLFQAKGGSVKEWAAEARRISDEHLTTAGAILFRGTPMRNAKDFTEFIEELGWQTKGDDDFSRAMQARSMTSTCVSDCVRTASDDHHNYTIEPHHEYHTVGFPQKIILFCQECPEAGGEWPVGDGRAVLQKLDPAVVEKFERLGARYVVYYPSVHSPNGKLYNNWETNVLPTKEETEGYLADRGYDWKWGEDNSLTYWQNFPAVRIHPQTGERVWFNQIHAHHKSFYQCHPVFHHLRESAEMEGRWPVDCLYGDGTPIEQDTLDHIREVVWENTYAVQPLPGDVLLCDNWLALHGRMGYPESNTRKVFVATCFE